MQPLRTTAAVAAALAFAAISAAAEKPDVTRVNAFYFGNSLLENAMPPFHVESGRSAGREWHTGALVGPGWTIFMNLHALEHNRHVWSSRGSGNVQDVLRTQPWDAVVVQPFGWFGLHRKATDLAGWIKEAERGEYAEDIGDVESAGRIFTHFLKAHAEGECLLYEQWPELPKRLGPDGKPYKEPTPGPGGQGDTDWAPDREGFDYVAHWETVTYDAAKRWEGETFRTRDYFHRLMEELKGRLPDLWRQGRLRCIPVAEVYGALEKKMRAGRVPGHKGIAWFYTDTIHQRMGLPRYTIAATFYAVLFRDRPHNLDWQIYNHAEKYLRCTEETRFYSHKPDMGEFCPITPDLAQAVNDTIWEVVTTHPYTGLRKK
jgi:hypothetical protein